MVLICVRCNFGSYKFANVVTCSSKTISGSKLSVGIKSNVDYPDLDYPDYSIIRTFFSGPNFFMNIN